MLSSNARSCGCRRSPSKIGNISTKPCSTGTATDGGYTEAQFNFNVATYLQADLEAEGAQVVMTRPDNSGIGPCVTTRAAILNDAHADVAVDIHADANSLLKWSEASAFGNFLDGFSKSESDQVRATFARLVEAKRSPEGLKLNRYLRFAFARKPLPAIKTHGLQT